jgi:hypothetical protein
MNLHEIGILIAIFGVITPFYSLSWFVWFNKKEKKDLADFDECKKNGLNPTEMMKYANNSRRWNRASLFLISLGLVLAALSRIFDAASTGL